MACIELQKFAIDHEMSHQQSEKQSLESKHKTKLEILGETRSYLQLSSFTFLHCPIFTSDRLRPWSLETVPKL